LQQARANRAHAELLLATMPNDGTALQWSVTAAFYCTLHCLSAHLAQRGITVRRHVDRDAALADPNNGVPTHVYDAYCKLKRRSEGGRYLCWRFTRQDVRATVLDSLLADVAAFVRL
jgi:hypothetical protein